MDRRRFLSTAGAGLGVMLGPAWLRRAFGDVSLKGAKKEDPRFGDRARRRALAQALERAHAAGKPLLVFVIPASDDDKWDRGHAFGEFLAHATPAELAPLAKVELACATVEDLSSQGLQVSPGKKDLLLARVDGRGVTGFFDEVPSLRAALRGIGDPGIDDDALIARRIDTISKAVRRAAGAAPPELGRQIAGRYQGRPPTGTHWADDSSCGPTQVEETPEERAAREAEERRERALGIFKEKAIVGYGCGMGHLPNKSRRFLYFFTQPPED